MKYLILSLFMAFSFSLEKRSITVVAKYVDREIVYYCSFDDSGRVVKEYSPSNHNIDTGFFYYTKLVLDTTDTSNLSEDAIRVYSDFVAAQEILSEQRIIAPYPILYMNEVQEIATMMTLSAGKRSEKSKGNRRIISVTEINKRVRFDPTPLTIFIQPDFTMCSYTLELKLDTIIKEVYYVDNVTVTREYTYQSSLPSKIQTTLKYKNDKKIYSGYTLDYKIME
jgi:hypothetical protein